MLYSLAADAFRLASMPAPSKQESLYLRLQARQSLCSAISQAAATASLAATALCLSDPPASIVIVLGAAIYLLLLLPSLIASAIQLRTLRERERASESLDGCVETQAQIAKSLGWLQGGLLTAVTSGSIVLGLLGQRDFLVSAAIAGTLLAYHYFLLWIERPVARHSRRLRHWDEILRRVELLEKADLPADERSQLVTALGKELEKSVYWQIAPGA